MNDKPRTAHPGDEGHSNLLSNERPPKSDPVFECLGRLDELNSALGQLRVTVRLQHDASLDTDLRALQLLLGRIMGMIAAGTGGAGSDTAAPGALTDSDVTALEELERDLRTRTTIEPRFYVPGDGTEASALADVARARCRTAERAFVAFMIGGAGNPRADKPGAATRTRQNLAPALRFLNRLSDYLFVMARYLDEPG